MLALYKIYSYKKEYVYAFKNYFNVNALQEYNFLHFFYRVHILIVRLWQCSSIGFNNLVEKINYNSHEFICFLWEIEGCSFQVIYLFY